MPAVQCLPPMEPTNAPPPYAPSRAHRPRARRFRLAGPCLRLQPGDAASRRCRLDPRFFRHCGQPRTRARGGTHTQPQPRLHRRLVQVPHRRTSPGGIGAQQGTRRLHRRSLPRVGPRPRAAPSLRRAVALAARGEGHDDRAHGVRGDAARGCLPAGPAFGQGSRHHLPGHEREWRRHRRTRLRVQRQSVRLRLARSAGRRPQGEDRPRPLLGAVQLSRFQGAHGGEARPQGAADLLGSRRGRLQEGEDFSRWTVGAREPYPARLHHL